MNSCIWLAPYRQHYKYRPGYSYYYYYYYYSLVAALPATNSGLPVCVRESPTQHPHRGTARRAAASQLYRPSAGLRNTVRERRGWPGVVVPYRGRQDRSEGPGCRWARRAADSEQRARHHGRQREAQRDFRLHARRSHHRTPPSARPASVPPLRCAGGLFCWGPIY